MVDSPDITRALADALAFQLELGADEAIAEAPVDRFAETEAAAAAAPAMRVTVPPQAPASEARPVPPPSRSAAARSEPPAVPARPEREEWQAASELGRAATTLEELAEAMRGFEGSPLRLSARNLVFADGLPGARVMAIGEAPGGDEDRQGKPFVGRAGQLLDRMLAAIGLARTAPAPETAAYITNILPWRPPGNRRPSESEVLLFLPFVIRHIELAQPDFILALGGTSAKALMETATGIKRLRGRWVRHGPTGLPLLPTFHPAYLLRTPADKRLAWRDLLSLRAALDGEAPDI
jgi:DNA polymerase